MKLRKSHYGLKFGGMMHEADHCINGQTQLMFAFSDLGWWRVLLFSERLVNGFSVLLRLYEPISMSVFQCLSFGTKIGLF